MKGVESLSKLDLHSCFPFSVRSSYDASRDSLPSEPPTPTTKSSEALKAQLQVANAGLERLMREMEDLQANNKRLNVKIKETREESRKVSAGERTKSNIQAVNYNPRFPKCLD